MTRVSEGLMASFLFWISIVVLSFTGVLFSVVLHELFHVVLHWGEVVAFRIFPEPFVIAEVEFIARQGHSMLLEELVAYAISSIVLIATVVTILKVPHPKGNPVGETVLNTLRGALEKAGA